jgi:DGQHR domain-containing protein
VSALNARTESEPASYELRLPALAIRQNSQRTLYSFAVDGKKLPLFAAVSRVKRDGEHQVAGYQRAESIQHIRTIRRYLETTDAVLPNALVVAFDSRVRFDPIAGSLDETTQMGHLIVPVHEADSDEQKPAWIVDGQQRTAAIREADIAEFPVYVTAFITDSVSEQRSQFILVNSTKPLPKGLIHELLPVTPVADLPIPLLKRRYPAQILDRLNYDPDSPLRGRIRTPTTTTGVIKDNSILKMLAMSIEDGALYRWFDGNRGTGDIEAMLTVLKHFWSAVASVFAAAWDTPPRRSRLVHGVGIIALGCLMDEIAYRLEETLPRATDFERELRRIEADCAWTEGVWLLANGEPRRWNELQNTPRDIKILSDHLVTVYRAKADAKAGALTAAG